jgi:thiol-disulfide isomerase/thioredoxin
MISGLLWSLLLAPACASGLTDFDGNPRDLQEFIGKGKWALVMFWASDCPICNAEAPSYVIFHDAHHDKDAIVLGVSLDGEAGIEAAKAFLERNLVDFPNLIGEPREVTALFTRLTDGRQPWLGTPSFLLYSPKGELAGWHIGPVSVEAIEAYIQEHQGSAG